MKKEITHTQDLYLVGIYEIENPENNDIEIVLGYDANVDLSINIDYGTEIRYSDDVKHLTMMFDNHHQIGLIYEPFDVNLAIELLKDNDAVVRVIESRILRNCTETDCKRNESD